MSDDRIKTEPTSFILNKSDEDMEARRIFALNVKRYRKRLGLSQHGLANASRVSRVNISRYENMYTPARIAHVSKLADALGVTMRDLIEDRFIKEDRPPTIQEAVDECLAQVQRIETSLKIVQNTLADLAERAAASSEADI